MVNKLITKIKNKLNKNKDTYLSEEYMFSTKEIEDLKEQNKQKLENLKTDKKEKKKINFTTVSKKLDGITSEDTNEEIPIKENIEEIKEETKEVKTEEKTPVSEQEEQKIEEEKQETKKEEPKEEKQEESYINLSEKTQNIIMQSWNNIDLQQIDKDIIEGKDLLNHNYNITYGDKAAKFVHDIRKRYEVVICYLIGFNNEKKGIPNKIIFADKVDNEWKYLNKYIKLLEKIRNNRK